MIASKPTSAISTLSSPEGRRQVPVLVTTWSYSNCPFAIALPSERTEAVLHGLVEAFAFYQCVPRELWWDNPKTVALAIHRGRDRTLHPRDLALASHYTFMPRFCMPRTPTEKPRVEKRVQDLQRQWATPVPQVADLDALNAHLRQECLMARERTCGDNALSVAVMFQRDCQMALPTPSFDPCVIQDGQVDKYQTVRFDRNHYSVPRRWAYRAVSIKGYVDRIDVIGEGNRIATHPRSDQGVQKLLDPLHFLGTLEHKPAALDYAPVYRDWSRPPVFAQLRRGLDDRLGTRVATTHYIRVLQLLASHSIEQVAAVIADCLTHEQCDATIIATAVQKTMSDNASSLNDKPLSPELSAVAVRPTDLAQFDRLLPRFSGENHECRDNTAVGEVQPEATQAPNDGSRVGETGSRSGRE